MERSSGYSTSSRRQCRETRRRGHNCRAPVADVRSAGGSRVLDRASAERHGNERRDLRPPAASVAQGSRSEYRCGSPGKSRSRRAAPEPEYILTEEQNAGRLRDEASQKHAAAQDAWRISGNYVSLTLLFASVLFFGGITGTFTVRRVRVALGSVALILFIVTMAMLLALPVCKG